MIRLFGHAAACGVFMLASFVCAAAPDNGDARAASIAMQASRLVGAKAGLPLQTGAELQRQQRLTEAAVALDADLEAGRAHVSPAALARLRAAIDLLQSLPVDYALLQPKQAKANGTLSGTVRDAATGLPVTTPNSVRVQAFDFSAQLAPTGAGVVNNASINASGQYTLTLPPGNYHIRTISNSLGYINQGFGVGNCPDAQSCPRYVGTIVTVPDGAAGPTVDFSMPLGASISGNVKRSDTLANLAGVSVSAANENGFFSAGAVSDASGNYTVRGLPPGRYRVYTSFNVPSGLLSEVHNNVSCGEQDCTFVAGSTLVTVAGTGTTTGIDFSLDPGAASLSGTVTESGSGTPIVDDGNFTSLAHLISADGATFLSIELTAGGNFSFTGLRPGSYYLSASAPGYIGKIVDATVPAVTVRDCFNAPSCDPLDTGAPIALAAGAAVSGVNLALDRGATFSGNVRAAVGAAPIANANVWVNNDFYGASAVTDAAGNFAVRGLPPGVYHAYADAPGQNFVQTWLGDVPCRGFSCVDVGTPFTLASNATLSGQQFNMPVGGTIAGVIIDGATGFPGPRQTRLELFDSLGRTVVQPTSSGASGYSFTGLQPGAYKAVFASSSLAGWVDTAFGGLPCPRGGCDQSLLPTVFITAGAVTSGIGATLPRGPRILGRVTDAATGQPVRLPAFGSSFSAGVALNNNLSNYAGFATIDGAGNYISRTGFSPGPYFLSTFLLRNNTPIGGGYIDELYNDIACPWASCGLTSGNAITVAGADVPGFDIALSQGGAIAGTVTNANGGAPLIGVAVRAFNGAGDQVAVTATNPNGKYRLQGLPSGNYFLTTSNGQGFQDELFSGQSCEPFCNPVSGTAVAVAGTATTSGRDFALDQSVTISGTVSDGGPAANVPVEIYGQIGNLLRSTTTNAAGAYLFADLAPGRFYVRTRSATGRADDLFYVPGDAQNTSPTKPDCVGLACQVRRGTPIVLGAGGSFSSANLALAAPGVISGQVTNAAGGAGMSGVSLQLLDARGAVAGTVTTSATGNYSFSALAAGSYYLVSRGTPGFIDEAFPNTPCPASCNGLNGSTIPVTAGATSGGNNLSLSSGESISGTVRNSLNNLPIAGTTVQVYNSTGVPVAQIATNPSGNYELNNVADGNFFVRTQNSLGFINEVYNNRPCGGYCDILNGDAVAVSPTNPGTLIDFFLAAGGSISGRLTNAVTTSGIALAEVQALDINGLIAGRASTDGSGDYTIGGLQPGTYKLRTSNTAGYVNQVYRTPTPLTCSPSPCAPVAGTGVPVAGAVSGINLALSPGGTISGTAADLFNNPLPSGTAVLLDSNGIEVLAQPISNGLFEFNGLANGSYYVLIRNNSGLIDLLFPNVPCPAGACNITAVGTPIVLASLRAGASVQSVSNIDLRLPAGRAIAGRVTSGATPVVGATVYIFDSSGAVVGSGVTDALGDYVTSGSLPAGPGISYFAATASPAARGVGSGLLNEAWNNVPCMLDCGVTTVGAAIPLDQAVAPLPNISFDLQPGGGLRGTVSSSLGGPLALVTVRVVDVAGRVVGNAQSDSLGHYVVDGLAPGTYFARTINVLGLQDQVYGGATCGTGCNPLSGTPINVAGTNTTLDINFSLSQPVVVFANGFE